MPRRHATPISRRCGGGVGGGPPTSPHHNPMPARAHSTLLMPKRWIELSENERSPGEDHAGSFTQPVPATHRTCVPVVGSTSWSWSLLLSPTQSSRPQSSYASVSGVGLSNDCWRSANPLRRNSFLMASRMNLVRSVVTRSTSAMRCAPNLTTTSSTAAIGSYFRPMTQTTGIRGPCQSGPDLLPLPSREPRAWSGVS